MSLEGLTVVDDVPGAFTDRVVEAFGARADDAFSLALSGGGTARRCYERLAADALTRIDWWKVDVYWGDERCVPHDHEGSNYLLAREALLDRVGAANATHLMRCAEVDAYQLRVGDLGRFDVIHLGLGADGHTASLFAGSEALEADPGRLVTLNDDPSGDNPYTRMTLTFAGIARARLVLVTVAGEEKAEALAAVARGDDTPGARIEGERVIWLVDPAAASLLPAEPTGT
ncbi:6-phosphogluconolactonase [Iamia sp.]|uniref:6-phosphogluconolactonase n=1 Tax=Iamia sp. TaxID=2722710 RepID=UPI002B5A8114|nr:6-phosphogluconolactonase [Iamia sp.]HXH59264.1 6-phosphogluconolactonase [Iamia sp.]